MRPQKTKQNCLMNSQLCLNGNDRPYKSNKNYFINLFIYQSFLFFWFSSKSENKKIFSGGLRGLAAQNWHKTGQRKDLLCSANEQRHLPAVRLALDIYQPIKNELFRCLIRQRENFAVETPQCNDTLRNILTQAVPG
jgi:hypothetical protein